MAGKAGIFFISLHFQPFFFFVVVFLSCSTGGGVGGGAGNVSEFKGKIKIMKEGSADGERFLH